jgi:FKBP-type peptidyl-prolyl cis-trans isomerase
MKLIGSIAAGMVLFGFAACGDGVEEAGSLPAVTETAPAVDMAAMTQTESGLQYQDLEVGTGEEAANGQSISVHYTGWFLDGEKFDSSVDRGAPYSLTLPGQVIQGWNQGIPGMRVGGMRRLVIPPDLAYGEAGRSGIPPNSTLVFDVKLVGVGG